MNDITLSAVTKRTVRTPEVVEAKIPEKIKMDRAGYFVILPDRAASLIPSFQKRIDAS